VLGFSTTIAAAFAAIIMISGLVIILTTGMSSLDSITSSISDQVTRAETKLGETCSLGRIIQVNSNTIRMNITNTGETSFPVKEFSKIDVLVIYDTDDGRVTGWVNYNQTGAGEHWKVLNTYFNGGPEIMNPIVLSTHSYGVWDPLETIEIEIHLKAEVREFETVMVTLPGGYRAIQSNQLDYNFGEATIRAGDTSVSVTHGLSKAPVNIQLTPQVNLGRSYWVSNITESSFMINLSEARGSDSSFFWWCQK
jgi:archaellum component FlaF (FlaF/FlaG flagellin family)